MTKGKGSAGPGGASPSMWLRRPLCRRYILGTFDAAVVRLHDADGCRDHPVHWAYGWLADGECEALGAWIVADGDPEVPLQMLADLKRRGVERIWHVTGTDVEHLHALVGAAFSGMTAPSSVDRVRAEALAAWRLRILPSPELVAEQVRAGLIRAIHRHGSFESQAAVLDFVAGALQRTERRQDRGGVMANVRPRQDAGAHRVPPGI